MKLTSSAQAQLPIGNNLRDLSPICSGQLHQYLHCKAVAVLKTRILFHRLLDDIIARSYACVHQRLGGFGGEASPYKQEIKAGDSDIFVFRAASRPACSAALDTQIYSRVDRIPFQNRTKFVGNESGTGPRECATPPALVIV